MQEFIPYRNNNIPQVDPPELQQIGFTESPTIKIQTPGGYTATPPTIFHIDVLTPTQWQRVASIPPGSTYNFDPDLYYKVTVEYESTMVITESERFRVKRSSENTHDSLPLGTYLVICKETLAMQITEPLVQYIGLATRSYSTSQDIAKLYIYVKQTFEADPVEIDIEFVGLLTKNYSTIQNRAVLSILTYESLGITHSPFAPEFIGTGGV